MASFNNQSHRMGYIKFPEDYWKTPVKIINVAPDAIASGKAATAPLEELAQDKESLRRQKALELIEKIKSLESRLDLHEKAATLNLRRLIVRLEDLGGYHLFGHKSFSAFWAEYFPDCGTYQRAIAQSHAATVLRLISIPVTDELPTTNALRSLVRLGIRATTPTRNEKKQLIGNFQMCRLDRAQFVKEAWARACELAEGQLPGEKEVLKSVRELVKLHPELKPPRLIPTLEEQVAELTAQLEAAINRIKALEQLNQELAYSISDVRETYQERTLEAKK